MPHQCTNCGRAFEDGSKEMLSGCPDCGGNKFQFRPDGVDSSTPPETDTEPPEPPEAPGSDNTVARTVGKTAATVRDFVGSGQGDTHDAGVDTTGSSGSDGVDPEPEAEASAPATEDAAQASARGDVVGPDELPDDPPAEPPDEPAVEAQSPETPTDSADGSDDPDERPDLSELREELNEQFESIKVLEPGQYELNLMELYDREEYIVALEEDGRYSIQVPETIRD
ncbi:OapC/ArvC family zinc-ribbon domain-containing protein [Haloarcula sp. GH36]|uniref:OapC/ArvC family zinc-ribbon domain-containing protein n=1 Tax=Haloarcula montana TaxID=3111776 RepID=UPI002D7668E0|nr:Zn-ribbon containing protein [Haloarcula sp. GH36]